LRSQNKSEQEEIWNDTKYLKDNGTSRRNPKGLSPSTSPPLGGESFIGIIELTIPKVTTLSIQKRDYEKYLLGIAIRNLI
jgi:hypothetical protein